jgi:hypothetical protein
MLISFCLFVLIFVVNSARSHWLPCASGLAKANGYPKDALKRDEISMTFLERDPGNPKFFQAYAPIV